MRLPRPRLRLRTLLIAVAVAGLAIGGWQTWWRREVCLRMVRALDRDIDSAEALVRQAEAGKIAWLARAARARIEHDTPIRDRYRRVARYPWLPLPREPE